ncbi:tripartite tricarboxylate transporter permease [Microbacterium esteraromaticum]|uniref:Tripartite tricarboxylate transporter permease n=1 Tax=Microbacterium esteraromaticum TaxID=57043 RepID=A0A939IUE1_9MICO|nr:tripartite tricarboxylate transporter permease [Microbacterium esteraromaticum]MBN8204548.1 tripartite tricarboxylate transporter permease [Microbacterium esteraromaticum]MBN8414702.1 tripartite tricarboxylate transporter permease [Microbacterium esteraromaticum]
MTPIIDGVNSLLDISIVLYMGVGLVLGFMVGAFPGITATMAVALAAGFTMTLEPVQGLAVLLTIYVTANFGDRVPSILINTPGTPASIATTLDGYPMAKQGRAGLALTISAIASAIGILASLVLFAIAAVPIANFARDYFRSPELFALVVFGIAIMIGISSKSMLKGILAGLFGLMLGTVGTYSATADQRFTFGLLELVEGVNFIAVIIGLFGIAELFDQLLTHRKNHTRPISSLGRWWPNRRELKQSGRATAVGGAVGLGVGLIPAAGGDIAGLIGWERARKVSKTPDAFGKGSIEGVAASDTASSATLGGSLTTTMALGIPGDSVMAVMIGSMIIWGITPGPNLFSDRPDLVVSIVGIMLVATLLALGLSLVRMKGMVKLLDVPQPYLWSGILIFCIIGTYATSNSLSTVITMLVFGVLGVLLKRMQVPAGPIVLGLLLGPLAEENLARTLAILPTRPFFEVVSPIAIALLLLAVLSIVMPAIRSARKPRAERASFAESVLDTESLEQIAHAHDELAADPDLLTSTVRTEKKNPKEKK